MKKLILLTFLAAALIPIKSFGCNCVLPPSFCESLINFKGDFIPDIIIRGEIIGGSSLSKEVKINRLIYGKTNQHKITINNFWLCQPAFHELEDGKEYIIALIRNSAEFSLISCAIFLKIENEVVKGKIAPGVESLKFEDLGDLEGCGDAFASIGFEKNFSVFPNPASDVIKIKNKNSKRSFEILKLELYDVLGRKISEYPKPAAILPEETQHINIENLAAGVYFLKLSGNYQESFLKIVKQRI